MRSRSVATESLVAGRADVALELVAEKAAAIDLAIIDVGLPELGAACSSPRSCDGCSRACQCSSFPGAARTRRRRRCASTSLTSRSISRGSRSASGSYWRPGWRGLCPGEHHAQSLSPPGDQRKPGATPVTARRGPTDRAPCLARRPGRSRRRPRPSPTDWPGAAAGWRPCRPRRSHRGCRDGRPLPPRSWRPPSSRSAESRRAASRSSSRKPFSPGGLPKVGPDGVSLPKTSRPPCDTR